MRVPIKIDNSARDGWSWNDVYPFHEHAWDEAIVDAGPSPAMNEGPYLKVPWYEPGDKPGEWDSRHRVYPRWGKGGLPRRQSVVSWSVEREGEGWVWVVATKAEERTAGRGEHGG